MEEQAYTEQSISGDIKPSLWKSAITYGIYYAVFSILLTVVLYATGMMFATAVQYISIITIIAAVVLIQLHYRKTLGGFITYGQSLVIAIVSMFCAAIPVAIFTFILYKFIDPTILEQLQLVAEEKLIQRGGMTQEQINLALSMSAKFQTPAIISLSQLLNFPFMGLIIGLISSIFIKKQSPDQIFE